MKFSYKYLCLAFSGLSLLLFPAQPESNLAYGAPKNRNFDLAIMPGAQPGQRGNSVFSPKPGPGTAKMTIATRSLAQKDAHSSVMVNYPQVGNSKIDTELDFWAGKTLGTFVAGVKNLSADNRNRCSMLADYELSESSGNVFSIVFRITTETGGSHPDYGMVTFSYDLSDGRRLGLQDLFADTGGLLNFLSLYSYDILTAKLDGAFERSIKNGTTPDLLNFSFFALSAEGLILYFPPNQVADYFAGEQNVHVPSDKLTPFKPRANLWSAAQPAFKSASPRASQALQQARQRDLQ
ncbi:MAG: RsiV family protein [Deltaproteobacteria bacterium]|nr:RsiV family protein [Deltaproteobacteria bacterium]